jgi:SAM-dependent methyltransferase
VDVVLSNCVVNLSPEKPRVFAETFRVLKSGGRVAISDVVATAELPAHARADLDALTGCVSGAATVGDLERWLRDAGFVDVRITPKDESREIVRQWSDARDPRGLRAVRDHRSPPAPDAIPRNGERRRPVGGRLSRDGRSEPA